MGGALYLIEFLHQTTTLKTSRKRRASLYLIEFLHQTTTERAARYALFGCILLNFYIKPQPRAVFALILWLLCPVSRLKKTGLNSAEVDLMSFFRISKNKYSKISQKNSNCCGISGLARSLFPQKFRISPYCLSVTANMLVYPEGGIERRTRLM